MSTKLTPKRGEAERFLNLLEPNGELSDAPTEEPVSHPAVSTFGRRPSLTERSRELRWSRWIDP